MRIPKVIHYCWFGGNEIPEHDRKCIESWKKFCPDYEIIQWNESNYDVTQNAYMHEAYRAKRWGFVPDYARLDIIYHHGGIYLDTDVEIIRGIDALLEHDGFAGIEKGTDYLALGLGFGAVKGHPFIKELRDTYEERYFVDSEGKVDLTPNPKIITDYLTEKYPGFISQKAGNLRDDFMVYPAEHFCPQDYQTGKIEITENTYSIHHYHDSWKTPEEKRRIAEYKKYVKVFGEKNGERIFRFIYETKNRGVRSGIRKMWKYMSRG